VSDGPNNPPPSDSGSGTPPPPQPTPPQAPPVDPNAGGGGGGGSAATLGVRFVAKLLDGLIVGIPLGIVLAIAGLATSYVGTLIQAVAYLGYLSYLESTSGQTIGKKVMNLTVVDEAGNPPSLEAAIKRNAYVALNIIPTVLGGLISLAAVIGIAVTINSDPSKRGFHDKFAETGVIRSA